MKQLIIFVAIFVLLTQTEALLNTNKVYNINLDLPLDQQYTEITTENAVEFRAFLAELVRQKNETKIAKSILQKYENDIKAQTFDAFFLQTKSIAEITNSNHFEVILFNYMYEIYSACTSIITQNKNGEIIHGRNLDYGFQEFMKQQNFKANYFRGNKYIYTQILQVGFIGVNTAMLPYKYSFSFNERTNENSAEILHEQIVNKRLNPIPYAILQVIQNPEVDSYEKLVAEFRKLETTSSSYLIVGGITDNQGIVLTRNQHGVVEEQHINVQKNQWYVAQTNSDIKEYGKDGRKQAACKRLENITQANINEQTLLNDVLLKSPNYNDWTILTVMMSARKNEFYVIEE